MTTILIADDSSIVRKLLRRKIETATKGYVIECLEAADGKQALDCLISKDIHLALIDYNMPHLNGVEVLEGFKAANTGRTPYLFMITTEASSNIVMAAVRAGAHNYLIKNKIDEDFTRKVSDILLPQSD